MLGVGGEQYAGVGEATTAEVSGTGGGPARVAVPEFPGVLARSQRLSLGVPRSFTVAPDRDLVVFLRSRGGEDRVSCLWVLDRGEERLLVDPVTLETTEEVPALERQRRERTQERSSGIVAYSCDAKVERVVFAFGGRVWLAAVAGGTVRVVPTVGRAVDPQVDPTGHRVGYVCDGALHVADLDGGNGVLSLAPDGPEVTFGMADHVSMMGLRGYWWAPEGDRLLVTRVDTSAVTRCGAGTRWQERGALRRRRASTDARPAGPPWSGRHTPRPTRPSPPSTLTGRTC